MLIGLVGKTNVGKSTFFAAATLLNVERANRPFTTIKPNRGIASVRVKCVHKEFNVKDEKCVEETRFIPVELLDVAGLVPGAHTGRGLGNKFLDDLRQADVFIHIVDASGSTDSEGRPTEAGANDPLDDIRFLENELDEWMYGILYREWDKFGRTVDKRAVDTLAALSEKLSGLGFTKGVIEKTLVELGLETKKLVNWKNDDIREFAKLVRRRGKPEIIAANKADLPVAQTNIQRISDEVNIPVVPVIAEAELALRRAAQKNIIKYNPGDSDFTILTPNLPSVQLEALKKLKTILLGFGGTGVQQCLDKAVFEVYGGIAVYPVEDLVKLSDKKGNVLPDVIILKAGSTPLDLARKIHSELAERFLYAIDARSKQRLSSDYMLKNLDVIKVVSA
ncbi:MAG: redox-regulated ATPase YchF [Thermoprotei archaeon]